MTPRQESSSIYVPTLSVTQVERLLPHSVRDLTCAVNAAFGSDHQQQPSDIPHRKSLSESVNPHFSPCSIMSSTLDGTEKHVVPLDGSGCSSSSCDGCVDSHQNIAPFFSLSKKRKHSKLKLQPSCRKHSVSSLVDDILSELDVSFLGPGSRESDSADLQNQASEPVSSSSETSLETEASEPPRKKLARCMSRNHKSFHALGKLATESSDVCTMSSSNGEGSALRISELFFPELSTKATPSAKEDSKGNESALKIFNELFVPNLPVTVSNNSCQPSNLASPYTASCDDRGFRRVSITSNEEVVKGCSGSSNPTSGEGYGWFVQTDSDDSGPAREIAQSVYGSSDSSKDELAFRAPVAPKRDDDQAELEWAAAADTVDDVLGDFF